MGSTKIEEIHPAIMLQKACDTRHINALHAYNDQADQINRDIMQIVSALTPLNQALRAGDVADLSSIPALGRLRELFENNPLDMWGEENPIPEDLSQVTPDQIEVMIHKLEQMKMTRQGELPSLTRKMHEQGQLQGVLTDIIKEMAKHDIDFISRVLRRMTIG